MYRQIFLILFLFLLLAKVNGQDIHFTQFYTSPLTLNPSLTGDYVGDYRFMNTFRSQWRKFNPGYLTNSIGYDQQIYIYNERLSGGVNVVYDKSGINDLQVTKINFSVAYHKLFKKNNFHFGVQGGYVLKSYDQSKLSFPDQFNNTTGYFDTGLPTQDQKVNDNMTYVDVNAGIGWHRKFGKHIPRIGIAAFHLNRPDDSFLDKENKLPVRRVFTFSDKWQLSGKLFITPQLMYMEQVKANDFLFGIIMTSKSSNESAKISSVSYGILARNSMNSKADAIALIGGFRYSLFDFGLSYDVNVSELTAVTDKRGAFEISIIYTGLSTRAVKIKIPCERY
jgi:type IX secretion system PorP/SprF family membrane protein